MKRVNKDIEKFLNVVLTGKHYSVVFLHLNPVGKALHFNLVTLSVFSHTDQIFVAVLGDFKVVRYHIAELVHSTAQEEVSKQAENEFVRVFVFLKFAVVLVVFPAKSLTQFVPQLHAFKPFVHGAFNRAGMRVNDFQLLQEFEVGHVQHVCIQGFNFHIAVGAQSRQRRERLLNLIIVYQVLDKLVRNNLLESLIESVFSQV